MFIKIAGSIMVLSATTWMGFQAARRFADRPRQLRELQSALQMLETEITYGATPLPLALARIGASLGGVLSELFAKAAELLTAAEGRTAGEAWAEALENVWGDMALTSADREILRALGASLGVSDRSDQMKHLRLIREQLLAQEVKAREERDKNERMWRYLGFLTGLALVIVLL